MNTKSHMDPLTALEPVQVAAGSVVGAHHRRLDRPGQDAFALRRGGAFAVAVVADGCGSGAHSELGARLGANLYAEALAVALGAGGRPDRATLEAALASVQAELLALARRMGSDLTQTVVDHLLFTLVAAVVTPEGAAVALVGDGLYALDGVLTVRDAGEDDAPAYLGYALLGAEVPLHVVESDARAILIATDGAAALLAAPPVGLELPALALDDRVYAHPDGLRRRLHLAAHERTAVDFEAGRIERTPSLLTDDTTIAVLRRSR